MKLIAINGSSCSGKSSVIKILMQGRDNLFYLHYDSLKWAFSKYDREKHYKDVQRIVLSVAKEVFKMKYNVISDSSLTKEFRKELIDLAKDNGYEIIEINLEADLSTLLSRFNERVENAMKIINKDRKISNTSVDRFMELHEIYHKDKNENAITFNTSTTTPEEIAEDINKMF